MNIGRFRNYQCFTSLRKITIPLKKLWSKRWILKWPCRRGLFFHPHLHHTSFDSRRFVGTHCAWGQLETKETLVFTFWEKGKKLYPLLFLLFSLQQKPNSTSLPEAVAGLVWLARRLGLHHQGDCFTKIRLCTVYCVNSKLQRWNDNILYDCWIQILQIPWIRQSLLESSDSSSGDWTRSKEHAIARWIGWRPQCCQEFMVCCFSGAIWMKKYVGFHNNSLRLKISKMNW